MLQMLTTMITLFLFTLLAPASATQLYEIEEDFTDKLDNLKNTSKSFPYMRCLAYASDVGGFSIFKFASLYLWLSHDPFKMKFMKSRKTVRAELARWVRIEQNMEPLVDEYSKTRWSTFFPLQVLYFLPILLFLVSCCCYCCCCCCFKGCLDAEPNQDLVDEEKLREDLERLASKA